MRKEGVLNVKLVGLLVGRRVRRLGRSRRCSSASRRRDIRRALRTRLLLFGLAFPLVLNPPELPIFLAFLPLLLRLLPLLLRGSFAASSAFIP